MVEFNRKEIKFEIDSMILTLESESLLYPRPNLDGLELESKLLKIWFRTPNHLSLLPHKTKENMLKSLIKNYELTLN